MLLPQWTWESIECMLYSMTARSGVSRIKVVGFGVYITWLYDRQSANRCDGRERKETEEDSFRHRKIVGFSGVEASVFALSLRPC